MFLISKFLPTKEIYFTTLLALIPASFIAGNLIINLNIIILIISTLFFFRLDQFKIKFYLLDKLLFLYFFLLIVTGILNDIYFFLNNISWWKGQYQTSIKSILFLRYLLLYLSLRFLIEKKIINLKYFFISSCLFALFVCFDIYYQFIYGYDFFGFEAGPGRKLAGPFGDEAISGGFIQRFSIFSFFIAPIFFSKESKSFIKIIIPVLFIIFFVGVVLSGNRMPAILFIFLVSLIVIFNAQTRKFFLHFVIIFFVIFTVLFNSSAKVRTDFKVLFSEISKIAIITINKDFQNERAPQYLKEFASFYHTWRLNKYLGGGIKNFRLYCHMRQNIDPNEKFVCNMHPHNYYLEILTESGLIGLILILSIFAIIIFKTFIKKYFIKSNLNSNKIIIPFIFLFLVEIFPLKSTGSFFTTGNATYLFLLIGILVGLARRDISIEKKY